MPKTEMHITLDAENQRVLDEWDRLADYKASGGTALTRLEAQHAWTHGIHRLPQPCWSCGTPNNLYEGFGKVIGIRHTADPVTHKPHDTFHCWHCGIRMRHDVPFMAGARPWMWGRPDDITLDEERAALEKRAKAGEK